MRLIDADELIKGRVENDPIVIALKCAPTAYDVDKVVERLGKLPTCSNWNHNSNNIDRRLAIEIVKEGGVNEQ